jgi:Bacterial PH domain
VGTSQRVRFRRNGAVIAAALIAAIGAVPVASVAWYYLPVLLVPLLIAAWAWRTGTDADSEGLRLRAVVGRRRVPWSAVAELSGDGRGGAVARLQNGRVLPLPAVRSTDLRRLVAASGQALDGGAQ